MCGIAGGYREIRLEKRRRSGKGKAELEQLKEDMERRNGWSCIDEAR